MRGSTRNEARLVVAAQAGDPHALNELVSAYLPLVYAVVGGALGGLPDADDVVQETMLRALRELRRLRTPESFRPWLVTIATRQISTHLHRRLADAERTAALDEVADPPDADAECWALLRVELSSQRRRVVRASHWLHPNDRALLSLWWLETAGHLTRAELAAALGASLAHTGVRVQRMRHQLELSRSLIAVLDASPRCVRLDAVLDGWNGVPNPLWRKRIMRHVRSCSICTGDVDEVIPVDRLIAGLALLPVPLALSAAVLALITPAGQIRCPKPVMGCGRHESGIIAAGSGERSANTLTLPS